MLSFPARRPRLLAVMAATGAVLVVLLGTGIYGLVRGPDTPTHDGVGDPTAPSEHGTGLGPPEASSAGRPTPAGHIVALAKTTDPVAYARAVAEAIFTWDTTSGLTPGDYASVVIADADPTGYETNGLVADLSGYLPNEQAWHQLRQYRTAQTLTIHDAYAPDSWAGTVASAGDQLAPGTVAVTVVGTRHRAGTWFDDTETTAHDVTFTVFVGCPPMFDRCHVLRLSRLDEPLP